MLSPALVDKCVTFVAASDDGCCLCWSKCPLDVISDSGRYSKMSFSVSPGHGAKDSSSIAWIKVSLVR